MAVRQQHVINDLRFELRFPSKRAAFAQQSDIIKFIKTDLLPLADQVFDRLTTNDQTIRLDNLEIDLGQVSYESMRPEIAERFSSQLHKALAVSLKTSQLDKTQTDNDKAPRQDEMPVPQRMSRKTSELQIVQQFLTSGLMPWHATLHITVQFDSLLMRVLDKSATELIVFLRAGPKILLDRLIAQLPESGLIVLLRALVPGHQKSLNELLHAVDELLHRTATTAGTRLRVWTFAIRQLLGLRAATLQIDDAVAAVKTALAAEAIDGPGVEVQFHNLAPDAVDPNRRAESDPNRTGSDDIGTGVDWAVKLLSDGRVGELKKNWTGLTGPRRPQFETALYRVLRRGETRRTLVSALDDQYLVDLVTVLAPDAADWIVRLVAGPHPFSTGLTMPNEPQDSNRSRLWDYSIAYLVAGRGGQFNRLSYMESLLRQMAAHNNLDYATLLGSVTSGLARSTLPPELRIELGDLLSTLTDRKSDAHARPVPQHNAPHTPAAERVGTADRHDAQTPDVETLITLIGRGYFEQLKEHWAELTGPRRPQFEAALRRTLPRRSTRRRLVSTMSAGRLTDIVTVLAPDASGWIGRIVTELQTRQVIAPVAPEPANRITARLWDYSIAYLVVDRGSRFNKLSYMASLLRQMAAHDNLHYTAVLESFASILGPATLQRGLRQELVELVSELTQRETNLRRRPGPQQHELLTTTLGKIDILRDLAAGMTVSLARQQLMELIRQLATEQPSYLQRLLRELCIEPGRQNEAISAGAILRALEKVASTQHSLLASELSEPRQRQRDQSSTGEAEISDPRPADPERKDVAGADSIPEAIPADAVTPADAQYAEIRPAEWVVASDPADPADPGPPMEDSELLNALRVLRQSLWRWPEYIRTLLWSGGDLRHAGTGDEAGLRSALDAFLLGLSIRSRLSSDELAKLVGQLTVASGRSPRFWRRKLVAFARHHDDSQYPQTESFAALRLQSILLPAAEAQPARHYATVMERFERLVRQTETRPNPAALDELRALFESERDTRYLVNSMPEKSLADALAQLLARDYPEIRYLVEVMAAAALFQASYLTARAIRRLIWLALFDWLIGQGQPFSHATLARYLAPRLLGVIRTEDAGDFVSRLRTRLPRAARQNEWLSDLVPNVAYLATEPWEPEPTTDEDSLDNSDETGFEEHTFIANAGIALLAPYLPRLFAMLQLTDDNAFIDDAAAEHAAQLLQFIAADRTDAPEYELVLNKLLCGIPLNRPLARYFEVSEAEREAVNGLLNAVIEHWGTLGNTSQDGLRSSFLRREGRLHRADNGWHLLVENRAYDLLLDSLPWSYKLIKYAWMNEVLHVDWR